MAEFCWECWSKMHKNHDAKWMYRFDWDLCEGCGEYKPTVSEKCNYFQRYEMILVDLLCLTFRLIWYSIRKLIAWIVRKIKKK